MGELSLSGVEVRAVSYPLDFADQVRREIGEHRASQPLRVTKRHIQQIGKCEASWLMELDSSFPGWSPRLASGTVIHEALRLHLGARPQIIPPETLVEGVLHRLRDSRSSLGRWLHNADPLDLAELRLQAVDTVSRFQMDFPELDPALTVRADPKIELPVGDSITLISKPDLVLGNPVRGPWDIQACAVGVEFKTGATWPGTAAQELNFHSVCETLRFGAPLAVHYGWNLTTGQVVGLPATPEAVLGYAGFLRRLLTRMTALLAGQAASMDPGWWCEWCTGLTDCEAQMARDPMDPIA